MATRPRTIDPDASATFKLRIAGDASICTVNRSPSKARWGPGRIIRGLGDECTLSVNKDDEAQQFPGRISALETSFVLMSTETANVLELVPLETEYDFDEPKSLAQGNGHAELSPQNDDEPDPDNPYDYRHYLHEVETNGQLSPYSSTAGTPLLAPTPRASSPMMLIPDTESLPSMPTTRKQRKAAAAASHKATQSQTRKQPVQRVSPHPAQHFSPAPVSSSPDITNGGLIIEDYSQPTPKRQRTATSNIGPISLARASSTPREPSREAIPALHTASIGDDEEEEVDDDDGDVEDFRLPDPAAGLSDPSDRKDSIFDPVAVSNLLAAFAEGEEDHTEPQAHAQAQAHKAESSESESEEE